MRVGEETLNRGWVCMRSTWWLIGLLVGASKYEKAFFSHFFFPRHTALAALAYVLCSSIISIKTKKMGTATPTNTYLPRYVYSIIFVFRLCSSDQLLYTHQVRT